LLAGLTGPIAVAGHALDPYLRAVLGTDLPARWPGSVAILAAGLVHGVHTRGGAAALSAIVAAKLIALIAFVWFGACTLSRTGLPTAAPVPLDMGAPGAAVISVSVSFSYSGWNGAAYLASEIRDPDRNLSRSLWIPTLAVTLLYLALNAVFVLSAPVDALSGRADVGVVAAASLGGARLQRALAAIVVVSLFTSIAAMVLAGPRVYERMARDGLLPSIVSRGGDAPAVAIALQVVLAWVVLWTTGLADLTAALGFLLGLSATATDGVATWLRRREGRGRGRLRPGIDPGIRPSKTLVVPKAS